MSTIYYLVLLLVNAMVLTYAVKQKRKSMSLKLAIVCSSVAIFCLIAEFFIL